MPGFDKTGPEGKGSKTGRGLGTCADSKTQEKNNADDLKRPRGGIRNRLHIFGRRYWSRRNRQRNTEGD